MVLSIATTHSPATDLGYLLHKHPDRVHARALGFGGATLFFPEASEARCEAVMALEIDPVALVRGEHAAASQYVSDVPYALNSFFAVALKDMFSSAIGGRSKDRPELIGQAIPLEIRLPVLPVRGGLGFLRQVLEPLGYEIDAQARELDPNFPEWGASRYWDVTLRAHLPLPTALQHLYILLPVLDDAKHYYIDREEIEKLMRAGEGWLGTHPAREAIVRRYLRTRRYANEALDRLMADDPVSEEIQLETEEPEVVEKPTPTKRLHELRLDAVVEELEALGAESILDLGCGEGKLLRKLAARPRVQRVLGLDVSFRSIQRLEQRLSNAPSHVAKKIELRHGSLTYRDRDLRGFDAAALVEVIEHLDLDRLDSLERNVFGDARPRHVLVTTPNREYNVRYELANDEMRHDDHRFEWSRAEFVNWGERVASSFGYGFSARDLGETDPEVGAPSQMGVFTRAD